MSESGPEVASERDERPARCFRFDIWIAVTVALGIGGAVLTCTRMLNIAERSVAGQMVGALAMITALTWLAWRIAGRNQIVARGCFIFAALAGNLVLLAELGEHESARRVAEQNERLQQEYVRRWKEVKERKWQGKKTSEERTALAVEYWNYAAPRIKSESEFSELRHVIWGPTGHLMQRCSAERSLLEAFGQNMDSLPGSAAEIDRRLTAIANVMRVHGVYISRLSRMEAAVRKSLQKLTADRDQVALTCAAVQVGVLNKAMSMAGVRSKYYVALAEQHQKMKVHWGKWSPDRQDKAIESDNFSVKREIDYRTGEVLRARKYMQAKGCAPIGDMLFLP